MTAAQTQGDGRAPKTDARRRALYGKIEIAKKALALDDDAYRDIVEKLFGKRSRTKLSNAQLVDLVEHFKSLGFKPKRTGPKRAGTRPLADSAWAAKIRALWLSLYHLGLVSDPSETALSAFVKRQAKVDDMRWLAPEQAFRAIEALKQWAARPVVQGGGGVDWSPYSFVQSGVLLRLEYPWVRVMEAQWRILAARGAVRIPTPFALAAWVERFLGLATPGPLTEIDPADANRAIEALGKFIREGGTP